ncbi:MAG: L-ribulose-5-phosphate 4-epimerase AraD [Treponemataceae bacterium]|nr:L-ribulose-5-phosphate 4-epimerase AraD [Treponemataceae bacterium]
MKSPYQSLKEEAFEANMEIPKRGLAIYTWGNVSAYDKAKGVFAIKPSGVPYDTMKVDDIVVLDLDGNKVEGTMNPSSDTPTHIQLYRNFQDIGGVTHTHSPHATSWAQACRGIPLLGTTHADHSANPVPCTPMITKEQVEKAYEDETGILIVNTFLHPETVKAVDCYGIPLEPLVPSENPMVLVAGHGPFTWGANAAKSVYNAAVLEEIARMAWITLQVNPDIVKLPDYVVDKHYQRKHGKNAYYGQK